MTEVQKHIPKWILVISALFALLEIVVSLSLYFSPQFMADTVDLNAKGVRFLIYMWAGRQFALGFMFAFATIKKSIPMLTITYIFFLVMFVSDLLIGIIQNDIALIISALIMCLFSSTMLFLINRKI